MERTSESQEARAESHFPNDGDPVRRQLVIEELDRVLHGKRFQNSGRAKQFLQFIVERALDGHSEDLKERTIGTELFQRNPNYSTGDDPVVRVQAGLVRRRLDQHYQEAEENFPVRIELPLGSYAPEFRWRASEPEEVSSPEPAADAEPAPRKRFLYGKKTIGFVVATVLILVAGIAFLGTHRAAHRKSALEQFWAPALAAQQPVLFCVSSAVTYRPKPELYERYRRQHPGTFPTRTSRSNVPLPLDPSETIKWGELDQILEWGITRGDLVTAVKLAAFFGKIGKPIDLRLEAEYTFRDLRDSPAVLIGAFNNDWTMNLVSDLRYSFVEKDGIRIKERGTVDHFWPKPPDQSFSVHDYAIISRLKDSKTGQFTVIVAGLTSRGTEAAAEFISSESDLEKFLASAPADWESKSMELVLETEVTDGVAGPPTVVASDFW